MSAKWKIIIHLVVVLIIGIVIGALLNRALVQKRIRDMVTMRNVGLRVPRPERVLEPADAEQEAKIQAVLDKHAQRLSEIHQRFDSEIDAAFKSLKDEIDPILTPEQKKAFEKMIPGPPPPFAPQSFPGGPPRTPGESPGPPGGPPDRPGQPQGPPSGPEGPRGRPAGKYPFEKVSFSAEFELAMLKTELNLSADQAAKIKVILDNYVAKRQALSEKDISPDGWNSLKREEEKKDREIEKLLSAGQKEKYREVRSRMFERPRWPAPPV
jgi:hypothetical protein